MCTKIGQGRQDSYSRQAKETEHWDIRVRAHKHCGFSSILELLGKSYRQCGVREGREEERGGGRRRKREEERRRGRRGRNGTKLRALKQP